MAVVKLAEAQGRDGPLGKGLAQEGRLARP